MHQIKNIKIKLPCKSCIEEKTPGGEIPKTHLKFGKGKITSASTRRSTVPRSIPIWISGSASVVSIVVSFILHPAISTSANIIICALAIVNESLISLRKLLEFEGGGVSRMLGGLRMFVRVKLHRQIAKSLLYLFFARIFPYTQHLIMIHLELIWHGFSILLKKTKAGFVEEDEQERWHSGRRGGARAVFSHFDKSVYIYC